MPSVPSQKFANMFRAGHHAWRRCSSVEYCLYAPLSRLASRAPRAGTFVRELLTRDTVRPLVVLGVFAFACTALVPGALAQGGADIPRTPSGRPDLSGNYDTATVTPLQRSRQFGNRATLTAEEVAVIASDPDGLARTFSLAPTGRTSGRRRAPANRSPGLKPAMGPERLRRRGEMDPAARLATSAATTRSGSTAGTPDSRLTASIARRSSSTRRTVDSRRGHRKTGRPRRHGGGLSGRTAGPRGGSRTT